MQVLVKFEIPGTSTQIFAETRNVSAQGIYFCIHWAGLEIGQEIECVLVLPEKLTLASRPSFVHCRGRILRVTPDLPDNCVGVAMEVNSFDFSGQAFPPAVAHQRMIS